MKAFPIVLTGEIDEKFQQGMDLRDYFAAQAMLVVKAIDYETTAKYCYALADKMMKAREKNESN